MAVPSGVSLGTDEFQFPMCPAERKRRFGRVAGRIFENIAAQKLESI